MAKAWAPGWVQVRACRKRDRGAVTLRLSAASQFPFALGQVKRAEPVGFPLPWHPATMSVSFGASPTHLQVPPEPGRVPSAPRSSAQAQGPALRRQRRLQASSVLVTFPSLTLCSFPEWQFRVTLGQTRGCPSPSLPCRRQAHASQKGGPLPGGAAPVWAPAAAGEQMETAARRKRGSRGFQPAFPHGPCVGEASLSVYD